MKKEWDALYEALAEVQDEIEELLPDFPQSKNFTQRAAILRRKWGLLQKLANDLNEMILPTNPIPVKSPFDHVDFLNAWQLWKDYLQEQHKFDMRSRMEVCSLQRLAELSGNDYLQAIRILKFFISTGYKNFYQIDEKNQIQPVPVSEDIDTIKYK